MENHTFTGTYVHNRAARQNEERGGWGGGERDREGCIDALGPLKGFAIVRSRRVFE